MMCPRCGNVYSDEYATCTTCGASRVAPVPVAVPTPVATAAAAVPNVTPLTAAPNSVAHEIPPAEPRELIRPIAFSNAQPAAQNDRPAMARPTQTASPAFARDTTRYLCAAVLTNSAINNAAIRMLIDDKHQALAFSPGVDTATVLKYAVAGRIRRRVVDALLGLEVLIFLWLFVRDGFTMLFWGAVVAWLTVHADAWDLHRHVLRTKLRRPVYDRKGAPEPKNPRVCNRIETLAALNADENVTVGTLDRPFPGFGTVDMERSSAIDITTGLDGSTATPFSIHDLYARVERDLCALDLPGVHVAPRVLLDGRDLPHLASNGFEALLPNPAGPPATHVDDHVIRALRDNPVDRARSYLAVRVTGWSGEVVVTYFVRFHRLTSGDLLFVELSRTGLAPLREEFHRFDRDQDVFGSLRASLSRTPRDALGAVPRLVTLGARWAWLPVRHWLEADAIGRKDFAYRPRASVRELAALPPAAAPVRLVQAGRARRNHRRFQDVDREMYDTLIERKLVIVIAAFLAEHGVTADRLSV